MPVQSGVRDDVVTVIYLHGFASGITSSKATYIGQRLRKRGVRFEAPDLNLPDFSTLTVTRMLEQTSALITASDEPVVLMGSSLGGFVAVNAAAQRPADVSKLVLLAPALDFNEEGLKGPGGACIEDWQRAGHLNVFHYGYGRMMPIHYELYADARRFDALHADLQMPVLVFQGRRDATVNPLTVESWAHSRSNVELHMLDDDHQLGASLGYIWDRLASFLNLESEKPGTR